MLEANSYDKVATLNEFRNFFGLQSHKTFTDINPDPYVAETLQKLYDHPDLVELYVSYRTCPRLVHRLMIAAGLVLGRNKTTDGSWNGPL